MTHIPGLCHDFVILDVGDKAEPIGSGVVVRSHGTLNWEESELLEQTGDDQEHPVLGQDLQQTLVAFLLQKSKYKIQQENKV